MPLTKPFPHPESGQLIAQIQKRFAASTLQGPQRLTYSPGDYEKDVRELLTRHFPYGVLSGLRLFNVQNRLERDFGFEMDNIVHLRHGGSDFIVVIEAKKQEIKVEDGKWLGNYGGGRKCAKAQVDWHIKTLWEYLEPIRRDIDLKFVAIVASVSDRTPSETATGHKNSEVHLCPISALPDLLAKRFHLAPSGSQTPAEVLRVSQSSFLDLLRLSLPVPELGHPEIASAIRYVERCRRTLDENLFQDFVPTSERWVINGSAGMGKSVLLAYTAAVLSSGYELSMALGELGVYKADKTFEKIGYQPDAKRGSVCIMAMSAKQLENIQAWFELFIDKFRKVDQAGAVRFHPPKFELCRDAATVKAAVRECSALVVDEAHDIQPFAAKEIAAAHAEKKFYLVVACDRHQRLRFAGSDARIIEGVNFRDKSKRLRQIYRSPAPVYIASLALMFRWFAEVGPKVLPSATDLQDQFGFVAVEKADQGYELTIRSDAHPANSWCHTVAEFPNARAAFAALQRERVARREVLWVRFCEEDPDFDYEALSSNVTYHNCRIQDAHKISDKYVKGQDYPVVVIEGFPSFMDRYAAADGDSSHEDKMWAFRRELYLCASRATCFLYFICNVAETVGENAELRRIKEEISRLVEAVAVPNNANNGGVRQWSLFVKLTPERRKLDVFPDTIPINVEVDAIPVPPVAPPEPEPAAPQRTVPVPQPVPVVSTAPVEKKPLHLKSPITVKELAVAMGLRPFQVIGDLMEMNLFLSLTQEVPPEVTVKILEKHGFVMESETSAASSTSAGAKTDGKEPQAAPRVIAAPVPAEKVAPAATAAKPPEPKREVVDLISPKSSSAPAPSRQPAAVTPPAPAKSTPAPAPATEARVVVASDKFPHKITVTGPMSVMQFARELGVQHREVINSLTRRRIFATGSYRLDVPTMLALAEEYRFGLIVAPDE